MGAIHQELPTVHRAQGALLRMRFPTVIGIPAKDTAAMPIQSPRGRLLRRGRSSLANHAYHVTTTTKGRRPLFADFPAACAASRCFETPALLGDARMLAWVLMPDHAHWLLQTGERDSLACVVDRLKSASARSTNRSIGRKGAVWTRAYFDHSVRSDEDLATMARYIVANPLRAGLVPHIAQYPFWNAIWIP